MFKKNDFKKDSINFLILHHEELEERGSLHTFMDLSDIDYVEIGGSRYFCYLNLNVIRNANNKYGENVLNAMIDTSRPDIVDLYTTLAYALVWENYNVDLTYIIESMDIKEFNVLLERMLKIVEKGCPKNER